MLENNMQSIPRIDNNTFARQATPVGQVCFSYFHFKYEYCIFVAHYIFIYCVCTIILSMKFCEILYLVDIILLRSLFKLLLMLYWKKEWMLRVSKPLFECTIQLISVKGPGTTNPSLIKIYYMWIVWSTK